jgi:glycosidase
MTDALLYWVKTFGVDGFRCDVAEAVPEDYWRRATMELLNERPVFMLAEGAKPSLHTVGFDGSYGWGFAGVIQAITQGKQPAGALNAFVLNDEAAMPGGPRAAVRMLFTTNHDWNSWEKTGPERFGPALESATILTFTAPGMPLIYSGQEAGETKRLKFFDKDEIEWKDHPQADLYRRLAVLKRENAALWHGALAGRFVPLSAEGAEVVAFAREGGGQQVVTVANLTGQAVMVTGLRDPSGAAALAGRYLDLYGTPAALPMQLGPWTAVVLVREH